MYFHRSELHHRIEQRLEERLAAGMLDEVGKLHDNNVSWERLDSFGLEYRYLSRYLQGYFSLEERKEELLAKIRRFAKGQDAWFRKMEREGIKIHWFKPEEQDEASELVEIFLSGKILPPPKFRLKDIHYGPVTS